MLVISLKDKDLIKLMRKDRQLLEYMGTDLDKDNNTCAHIALLYDKQDVFSEIIDRIPDLVGRKNSDGLTIYDYTMKYERINKLDNRSYTVVFGSAHTEINTEGHLSDSSSSDDEFTKR